MSPPTANPAKQSPSQVQIPKLTPRPRRQQAAAANPLPVPQTPPLPAPPAPSDLTFTHPTRRILSPRDHALFLQSPTYHLLSSFVFSLSDAVRDCPASAIKDEEIGPTARAVLRVLDGVEGVLRRCPPEDQGGSRFGNKGFRRFLDALAEECEEWHEAVGVQGSDAIDEVSTYLMNSFGNGTRIDYGSGHELNFIVWLYVVNPIPSAGSKS